MELVCTGEEEDDPGDIAEWGAFGFIFELTTLSFVDARPRGLLEVDYVEDEKFYIADFFDGLHLSRSELHFRADYIWGRSVKTDITVRADGTVTLATWGRGQSALRGIHVNRDRQVDVVSSMSRLKLVAALRWLDRLKGKRLMQGV